MFLKIHILACSSDISDIPKGSLLDEPMLLIDTSRSKLKGNKEKSYGHSYANMRWFHLTECIKYHLLDEKFLTAFNLEQLDIRKNRELIWRGKLSCGIFPVEAGVVSDYVSELISYGVREEDIGIIAPYAAQVSVFFICWTE